MENSKYTEILKLKEMLEENKIPFDFFDYMNGNIISYPNRRNCVCSIIEHDGSYGHQGNLLEIMGLLTEKESECDDVVGWLTSDNVFNRILNHWKKNK